MTVADLMEQVAKQDAEGGWERVVMPGWVLTDAAQQAADGGFPGRVFASGDAVTTMDDRLRYIDESSHYAPYTAGELARAWLQTILDRAGRRRVSAGQDVGGTVFGPALFFDPPGDREGEWVMIDVKACYWSLYSRLPLDTRFFHTDIREFGWRPTDYLREYQDKGTLVVPEEDKPWVGAEKPLRNAAWGAMSTERIQWTENGETHSKPARSRFRAPGLTQAVLAQVQAIAWEARELGAVMWLTDAAICRPGDDRRIWEHLTRRWGLESSVKAIGSGHLYGLGDYKIGDVETNGSHQDRGGYDGLQPLNQQTRDRLASL